MNYVTQGPRLAWVTAVLLFGFSLSGCNTLSTPFNLKAVDSELDKFACKVVSKGKTENDCRLAYEGKDEELYTGSDGDPESLGRRQLRLLRAYVIVEASARFAAARISTHSDDPSDDAVRMMGSVALAMEALSRTEAEFDRQAVGINGSAYAVDRVEALFRVVSTVDVAARPTVRGITGLVALSSAADRLKGAAKIIGDFVRDTFFIDAYEEYVYEIRNQVDPQGPFKVPYDKAKGFIVSRINTQCIELGKLAKLSKQPHLCGQDVK
jgi:hypothetical protein